MLKYKTLTSSVIFTICLLFTMASNAKAVNYTVTNTSDNGAGSLRAAVTAANPTTADDTISFAISSGDVGCTSNGVCTITLTSGELVINRNTTAGKLTITNASGANKLFISGNNASRVFFLRDGAEPTINGVTITRGNGTGTNPDFNGFGGGIATEGGGSRLTLTNSALSNNSADFYGGGVFNYYGTATLTNSTVDGNSTQNYGGGIFNTGTLTLTNSTLSENSTRDAFGGGIFNNVYGTTTLTNVTISGNSARFFGGGVFNESGGTVNLLNTIIAGNIVADSSSTSDFGGAISSTSSFNIIGITDGTNGITNGANGNRVGTIAAPIDARLAPLSDNGGATRTRALLSDSPAIDNGTSANAPITDQRGATRIGNTDIGAFEFRQDANLFARTPFDFDFDGRADIAVTRANGNNLTWYLLNSQTGFTGVNFGFATDKIAPADYDGDGKTDITVVRTNANNTLSVYILLSKNGGFLPVNFGTTGDIFVPADFDGDGKADLAVFRVINGQGFFIYTASATQQTGNYTVVPFGATGDKPVIGDFDGDGKADLAVVRRNDDNLSWYIQLSRDGFTATNFGKSTDKAVAADYDGDGKTDIAVFRDGDWSIRGSKDGLISINFGQTGDVPVPADYDGDGKADIAVTQITDDALTWYLLQSQAGSSTIRFGAATDAAVENVYVP